MKTKLLRRLRREGVVRYVSIQFVRIWMGRLLAYATGIIRMNMRIYGILR